MSLHDGPWVPGTPCWVDLASPDPDASSTFYSALLGWDVEPAQPQFGGYRNARLRDRRICGLAPTMSEGQQPAWTTYLATSDMDATEAAITAAGGWLLMPAMDVADLGRTVLAFTPDGGFFGAWQAGTHAGSGVVNEPGAPVWNEYLARDYPGSKAFYEQVFGVGLTDIGDGSFDFATMEVDGNTVGGIGALADPAAAPRWRIYFAVEDTDAALARAVELGGAVVAEAHDSPFGRWAELGDPHGAAFSVITTPEPG